MDFGIDLNFAAHERLAYLRQQAEQDRLAYRFLAQQRGTVDWLSAALIWLGQSLAQWGTQLQRRRKGLDILSETAM